MATSEGLMHKYNVERADGDPHGKHKDCRYFVLDPQCDRFARAALISYMLVCRRGGWRLLADDLRKWLLELGAL